MLDNTALAALRPILEDESPVIVVHRFYRVASAPHRFFVDRHENLVTYVRERGRPGDSLYVWVSSAAALIPRPSPTASCRILRGASPSVARTDQPR